MAEDIYLTLSNAYTPEKPLKKYREVTTKENGICYRANINPERAAVLFQIDGYVITSGAKCDKLLLSVNPSDSNTWYGHFIELKGTDTRHAIEQLEATITNALFNNSLKKSMHALWQGLFHQARQTLILKMPGNDSKDNINVN